MTETVTLSDRDRGVTVPSCREKKKIVCFGIQSVLSKFMPSSVPHIVPARGETIEVPSRLTGCVGMSQGT